MAAAEYGAKPFKEQLNFFRDKVRLPTLAWTDLWEGMHARAFVVAGAVKDELLADFQTSITKAIEQGTTLAEFRRDFDDIVARHGWNYKGGRGWRTRVIYHTNLRTSYAAGRYKQMQEVTETRPYWQYKHSFAVQEPRQQHLAWDGMVLRHDDPFWDTHYPPNGWGCQCYVETLDEFDMEDLGKTSPDSAPVIKYRDVVVGERGPSPRTVRVPEGIDPGWGYNVGEAAWGRRLSETAMLEWQESKDKWDVLPFSAAQRYQRPDQIPLDKPKADLVDRAATVQESEQILRNVLGGEEKIVTMPSGQRVLLNAKFMAEHLELPRTRYIPLLLEALEDPFEEWHSFQRHRGTGKVVLRSRIIKAFDIEGNAGFLLIANASRGMFEGWTVLTTNNIQYINNQRKGRLAYER